MQNERECPADTAPSETLAPASADSDYDLMSTMCHDLRDPLSAILMGASFLTKNLPQDESSKRARRTAEAVTRSAERLDRLVRDFHDVSRIQCGKLSLESEHCSVTALINIACDRLGADAAEKSVRLVCDVPESDIRIICDQGRIVQVLMKLAHNAIRFASEAECKVVEVSGRGEPSLPGENATHGAVHFHVRDHGAGVSQAVREHLFDHRWHATRAARDGSGMGLAIAKGVIDAHSGHIWADEADPADPGASFHFTLPQTTS